MPQDKIITLVVSQMLTIGARLNPVNSMHMFFATTMSLLR